MSERRLVIVGGSGHASDVLGAAEEWNRCNPDAAWELLGLVSAEPPDPRRFDGRVAYLGTDDDLPATCNAYVIGVGYPAPRRRVADAYGNRVRMAAAVLVHPHATVPADCVLGPGTVVLAGARLSNHVDLGAHVAVGANATVGHDVVVGSYTSIMPAACVAGDVRIGEGAVVGANATVLEGRSIGDGAIVGAGAVVTDDVASGMTVVGVPARPTS